MARNDGVSVEINVHGTPRELLRIKNDLEDLTTPLRQSGQYMEGVIGRRFKNNAWAPLSETTLRIHPHRIGGKPLLDTGNLRNSVTSRAIKQVSSKKLEYGPGASRYAKLHNFGGQTSWGTYVPKREFLYFSDADKTAIKRIFNEYVERVVDNG